MAKQNWDQYDVHTTEDNAFSYLPTPDPQSTDFSSQWLFTPDFTIPPWPRTFSETQMSTGSKALLNPPSDVALDPPDLSSEDAIIWGTWDTRDEIGDEGIAGWDTSVVKKFVAGQVPSQTQSNSPSMERSLTSTSQIRRTMAMADTRRKSSKASRSSRTEYNGPHLPQSHSQIEEKYRSRLRDQFSALLKTLPKELVLSSVGGGIGTKGEKVDILDLSVTHIRVLEAEQEELEQDSLALTGQVHLLERLIKGPEG